MVIAGEKRTEHAVNQTGCEDFIVRGTAFTLEEAAGEASERGEFFLVFNLKGHKVHALAGILGRHYSGKEHRVAHAHFNRSIGLLGQLASLDCDLAAIRKFDGFLDWV